MIRTFICTRPTATNADPGRESFDDHRWSKESRSPRVQTRPDFYTRCPDHDGLGGGDGPDENSGRMPLPVRKRRGYAFPEDV